MRRTRALRLTALVAGTVLAASACGVTSAGETGSDSTGSADGGPLTDHRIMVPNSAGGGYDVTARTAAKVMEDEGIASGMEVFNLEGAG